MGMTRRRIIRTLGWLPAGPLAAWSRAAAAQPTAAPPTLARLAEAEAALFLEHGATLGALSLSGPLSAESRAMLRQRRGEADAALDALLEAVRSDSGLPGGPALSAALGALADSQTAIRLLRAGMDRPAPGRPTPSAAAWAEARARQDAAMGALRGLLWGRFGPPAPPPLPPPGPEVAPAGPQAAAPPAAAPAPRAATEGPAPDGKRPAWPWLAWPWLAPAGGLALLLLLALRAAGRERTDQGRAAPRVAVDWPAEIAPAPGLVPGLPPVAVRIVSLSLGGAALRPERAGWGGRLRLLLPGVVGRRPMRLRNARLGEIEVQLVRQEGGLLRLRFLALDAAQAALIGGLVAPPATRAATPAQGGPAPPESGAAGAPPPAEWESWRGG